MSKVIIAAGGTGGHLWPALSLARAIEEKNPNSEFLFVGTGRPIEEKILGPTHFPRVILKSSGFKGGGVFQKVKAVGQCLCGIGEARKLIAEFKPDLCFAAGGYVTVPVGLAAKLAGVPLVLHEQNSRPGLSNRVLSRVARKIFLGFDDARTYFPLSKVVFTGNPIRPEIEALSERSIDFKKIPPTILVTGGSQGARGLNEKVVAGLIRLKKELHINVRIIHQAGSHDLETVRQKYQAAGIEAQVESFFPEMADFYAQGTFLIARAGALTIAELAAAGLPSILVPLPTAADNHQADNARSLERAGAALLWPEADLNAEDLAASLARLVQNPACLESMGEAARRQAPLGVANKMAELCLEIIEA